jgi:serine/threonine-protein kinase
MAARPPATPPSPDDLIDGRYRLVEFVARGGSATVWRGHDERLTRPVAIKLLADDQRGRDEARTLARLSHPHIAEVFDYGRHDTQAYLVLELVDGASLADVLAHHDMPWPAAVAVAAQTAAALAAAHARGLVHRDITPGNIMLTPSGIKLIDFGISAASGDAELDTDGGLRGTPSFAAPERLTGPTVEPPVDMYSFGVVLYRMLAGRLPWTAPGAAGEPAPLPELDDLPTEVSDLCMQCLASDPAERPSAQQAAQILQDLAPADALAHFAATTVNDTNLVTQILAIRPPEKRSRSSRAGRLVAIGALAAAIWVAGWAVVDWGPGDQPAAHQAMAVPFAPPPVSQAAPACAAIYQLVSDDGRTFSAAVTVAATRQSLAAGWQLALQLPTSHAWQITVNDPKWRYDYDTIRSMPQRHLAVAQQSKLRLTGRHSGPNPLPVAATAGDRSCSLILLGPTATLPAPPVQVDTVTDVKSKPDPPKGSTRSNGGGKKGSYREVTGVKRRLASVSGQTAFAVREASPAP